MKFFYLFIILSTFYINAAGNYESLCVQLNAWRGEQIFRPQDVMGLLKQLGSSSRLNVKDKEQLKKSVAEMVKDITLACETRKANYAGEGEAERIGQLIIDWSAHQVEMRPVNALMTEVSSLFKHRFGLPTVHGKLQACRSKLVDPYSLWGIETENGPIIFTLQDRVPAAWEIETENGPIIFTLQDRVQAAAGFYHFVIPYLREGTHQMDRQILFHKGSIVTNSGLIFNPPCGIDHGPNYQGTLGLSLGAPYFCLAPFNFPIFGDLLRKLPIEMETSKPSAKSFLVQAVYRTLVEMYGDESALQRVRGLIFFPFPQSRLEKSTVDLLQFEEMEREILTLETSLAPGGESERDQGKQAELEILRTQRKEILAGRTPDAYVAALEEQIIQADAEAYQRMIQDEWDRLSTQREADRDAASEGKKRSKASRGKFKSKDVVISDEEKTAAAQKIRRDFIQATKRDASGKFKGTRSVVNAALKVAREYGLDLRLGGGKGSHFYLKMIGGQRHATAAFKHPHLDDDGRTDAESLFNQMLGNLLSAIA